MTKSVHLSFQSFEVDVKKCPNCGNEMIFIRKCCGDNEVWRCENCEYIEKELNQNIWYYYIWAK